MIDATEHFYDDDPARGHADVRTRLAGVSYFFLGNGLIQAAVQYAPGGEGTALALLVMNPERLGKKREALTMDPARGLEGTVVRIGSSEPGDDLIVRWGDGCDCPTVVASWSTGRYSVTERFYCPDDHTPRLVRDIVVCATAGARDKVRLSTGLPLQQQGITCRPDELGRAFASVVYTLAPGAGSLDHSGVQIDFGPRMSDFGPPASPGHRATPRASFGDGLLDRWFGASCRQLPAVVSRQGRVDASIWQYNREWARDQALVALGLVVAGCPALAATMFRRLLREFVTREGGTIDSSEVRGPDEVELDQNGVLLYALDEYVAWTGDFALVDGSWDRVVALADFPLRDVFRHPSSGLLHNSREFWERHRVHGIEPGFELAHQMFVSVGLARAAHLARLLGRHGEAQRWQRASEELRKAALGHPVFALVDDRGLVKRRKLDGTVQEVLHPRADAQLPASVPMTLPGSHLLNPDTSTMLPIVFDWIPAAGELATRTLCEVERLWNQAWSEGGYGRYHVTSEPDSPGAWPFASLFVARADVESGHDERAWRVLRWLDKIPGSAAGSWFEFYGPRVAPPFPQVGIIPWTWAEMLFLLVFHVLGVRPGDDGIRLRPRLLSGLEHVTASLPVRGRWLHLEILRTPNVAEPACMYQGARVSGAEADWLIPHDPTDGHVEIRLCR